MQLSSESIENRRRESIACGTPVAPAAAPGGRNAEPILEGQAWFTDEQVEFILEKIPGVLLQGQLSNGPWTAEFEAAAARHSAAEYATAFPSGVAGLEATLAALGVGPGDEVLLPAHSFADNIAAVRRVGAIPVFCDIAAQTHCLQPEEVSRKATPRTKAAILVHLGGLITPDIAEILGRCQARGVLLIEDCAHAQGARWLGRPAGSFGVASVFSFRSSRVLADGEGGAVVTNDRPVSLALRSLRDHNPSGKAEAAARNGHKNCFPEISALLGLAQYRSLPELVAARNDTASYYRGRLRHEAPEVALQAHPENISHAYYQFMLTLPVGASRDQVRLFLQGHHVPVSVCGAPLFDRRPASADSGDPEFNDCPVAADLAARSLCLPTDPRLSRSQRRNVIDVFLEAMRQAAGLSRG